MYMASDFFWCHEMSKTKDVNVALGSCAAIHILAPHAAALQ